MPIPLYSPAPPWTAPQGRELFLFHGCTTHDQFDIQTNGIDLMKGRVNTDFGRGFYTTTVEYQARQWAWNRFYDPAVKRIPMNQPVVLRFAVDRHDLASMSSLAFVLGDHGQDDFWSLVQHCRQSTPAAINDHRGPNLLKDRTRWYDIVCGPVAAQWRQKFVMQDADQFSFHTRRAARRLNKLIRSGDPKKYSFIALI